MNAALALHAALLDSTVIDVLRAAETHRLTRSFAEEEPRTVMASFSLTLCSPVVHQLLDQMVKPVGNLLIRDQLRRALIVACEFRDVSGIGSLSASRPTTNGQVPDVFGSQWCHRPAIMPTTTSLLAFLAQGLRVAASFNRPITSALDHINENT